MEMITAITILLIFFALGDVAAKVTKGNVSMVLFTSLAFLIAFWLGLPNTIFEDSNLLALGNFMVGLMITSLGTLLNLEEMKQQWKTVILTLLAVTAIAVLLYFVGGPIIGKEMATIASPVLAGGAAATLIVTSELENLGLGSIAVFAVLIYVTQKFVGVPLASVMLKKEAKRLLSIRSKMDLPHGGKAEIAAAAEQNSSAKKASFKIIPDFPKDLQTPFILLAKISLVVFLCQQLENWTGINVFILFLLVGVILSEIGFLEKDILKKSNSNGIVLFITMCVIFTNLSKATPQMVLSYTTPLLIALGLGVAAVILVALILAKVFKLSKAMAISIGAACFFGFPTTYYIPHEIAATLAKNEEEKDFILDQILPKMLVAGFVSVTLVSVILAGLMVDLLK